MQIDQTKVEALRGLIVNLIDKNLPPEQFDMSVFCSNWIGENEDVLDIGKSIECGTVGCLAGWASICLRPRADEQSLSEYCLDLVLVDGSDFTALDEDCVYQWLFGSCWSRIAPTLEDALARLDYFAEHGYPAGLIEARTDQELREVFVQSCSTTPT